MISIQKYLKTRIFPSNIVASIPLIITNGIIIKNLQVRNINLIRINIFLLSFQRLLRIPSKSNKNVYGFNYLAQNYNCFQESNPKKLGQAIDCFYWSVLYSIRFSMTGEDLHKNDFSYTDPCLLTGIKTLKPQLDFDCRSDFFEKKMHLLNSTLISYNYILKVYVI